MLRALAGAASACAMAVVLVACKSGDRTAPAPGDRSPRTAPTLDRPEPPREPGELESIAVLEVSPVPSTASLYLHHYYNEALKAREAAAALDRLLASKNDDWLDGGLGWSISARRALIVAILGSPAPLRDELRLLHESPGGEPAEAAAVASQDLGKGKISRALVLHDRYPCATWAKEVRKRADEIRGTGPHDAVEVAALASPLPETTLQVSGITVRADGQDGLFATDVDGNRVWGGDGYRLHSPSGETHLLRVVGAAGDRIVAADIPQKGGTVSLLAIDVTTGNELFYIPVFPVSESRSEPVIALNGVEAAVHAPGRICVVDVRRGAIIWKREISTALSLASITRDRIGLTGPSPVELDVSTGRRLEAKTSKPPARPGTIEIK